MRSREQATHLTGDRNHPIAKALEYWIENSERFAAFVNRYGGKIRKRCVNAKSFEDLEDMRFELEIPYLFLLDQRFEVEYEKYSKRMRRSPDFTVTFETHIAFNVEVKRIRQAALGQRFDKWMEEVVNRICEVPSNLGFSLDMTKIDGTSRFLEQIESKKETIIHFVRSTILNEDKILQGSPYSHSEHLIPGIDGEFILDLTKLKYENKTGLTAYLIGVEPLFYNQKEPYKFSDTIFEKLAQMVPGMINIIVCSTASNTHEREDLLDAIRSINSLIKKKDDDFFIRKGFKGISDFLDHTKRLTAILFKGIWFNLNASQPPNLLWCNSKAECQIPNALQEYLSTMSYRSKAG
jgi:hypothetical protein